MLFIFRCDRLILPVLELTEIDLFFVAAVGINSQLKLFQGGLRVGCQEHYSVVQEPVEVVGKFGWLFVHRLHFGLACEHDI